MKKLGIFLMSAAALGFTACDDYEEVTPQSNPQQTIMAVDGLEVALADGLQAPINLETLEADSVELITTTATPEMNEGTYFTYNAEIAADNTFAQVQNVGLTNGKIAKEDLDNAFRALFGKTPNMREMHFRFVPYMTDGTSKVLFKKDTYLAATSQKVTPVNLGLEVDANGYYIVTDTWFNGGWETTLVKLENSGADVYDDAVFKATLNMPAAGDILIVGASDVEAAVASDDPSVYMWSPVADAEGNVPSAGTLTYGVAVADMKTIPVGAGLWDVSIDMLERTYSVKSNIPETLYAVGSFNNWAHDVNTFIYEKEEGTHSGFIDMSAAAAPIEYKFSTQPDWNGTNFGMDANVEGGLSIDGGAGNLKLEEAGIYYFKLQAEALTYSAYKVDSWGLVGDATPGGWDADTALEYKGGLVWESTVALTVGEYKFRANGAWDLSLGGAADNLIDNAGNIKVEQAGTYTVTLDLSNPVTYTATFTAQ